MNSAEHLSPEEFARIEAYVLRTMSAESRDQFQAEMSRDNHLSAEVELFQTLLLASKKAGLERQLNKLHSASSDKPVISMKFWIGIAAGLALLIAATFYLTRPGAEEQLFAAHVSVDPGLPVPMSATIEYDFYDAMVDYKSEDYDACLRKWNQLLQLDLTNDTLQYYIASAHFNKKEYPAAIEGYQSVLRSSDSDFRDRAEWYLVLSYLTTGKHDAIAEIADSTHSEYRERITQIRDQLKKQE